MASTAAIARSGLVVAILWLPFDTSFYGTVRREATGRSCEPEVPERRW